MDNENFESRAEATWQGDLPTGNGTISFGTGAMPDVPVTWSARTESSDGMTSPEELIAAAHASCFSMALTNTLVTGGHQPESLHVEAVVAFGPKDGGGMEVKSSVLTVRARVPSLDQAGFQEWAEKGEQGCPVSNALRGNIEITVEATLES
ncbi:MAG TPA: OsmC family peroxiredoxin [Thermomicrobiales bacterium]|nr:OsmC family peroxiredoxin [Thermomicrobiales bacterium]